MSPVPPQEPQATRAYVPPLPPAAVAVVARRRPRRRAPGGSTAVILLLLGAVVVGMGHLAEPTPHGRGEIVLQPTAGAGQHPFTASLVSGHPAPHPAAITSGAAAAPGQTDTATRLAITTTRGSHPGLYGGSRGSAACDAQALITGLQEKPAQAAAWAQVEGISPGDIPPFAGGLTAVVLRGDTRVTDHGFVSDHASIFQSVLESGTEVMVDHFGVPRVRCAGGTPLTPPVAVTYNPRYVGGHWPGFQAAGITVVAAAEQPLASLVLVDSGTGVRFSRPVGTDGRADGDAPAAPPAG